MADLCQPITDPKPSSVSEDKIDMNPSGSLLCKRPKEQQSSSDKSDSPKNIFGRKHTFCPNCGVVPLDVSITNNLTYSFRYFPVFGIIAAMGLLAIILSLSLNVKNTWIGRKTNTALNNTHSSPLPVFCT